MTNKPTYEELEQRVKELEKESIEQRSLECALRESQEHLKLAVDGANLAMWNWNVDTGKVEYSNRWSEILGYSPEEIKPHVSAWEELVHPEDMPQVMQKVNANLEGLTSFYECEHRLKSKSGEWIWVLARGKVVERDNDGKPLRHTGTQFDINDRVIAQEALKEARDALEQKVTERTAELVNANEMLRQEITERMQAEKALRESEERYRLLADNVTDVIWTRDMNLNLTYISPSITDQQGYTIEEAMDRTMEETLTPDSLKLAGEVFAEELEVERSKQRDVSISRTLEVEIKCKDGSTIITEIEMSFLRDQNGEPIGIIGVTRNITERRHAEEALRESESKFRNLFDLSPQAVGLTELKSGRLIDANNKFCELTKYSKEEILGLKTTEIGFYLEKDRSKLLKELQASGEVNGLEMEFKAKDNSILHALMFARIIQIEGESFILTIFYDITEQKRLETQLQQAQKMEAIGTLAGGIAHDFNNLLMGIQGRASLILADVDSYHPYFEHLKGVEEYVKSAADLTKQLLAFARGGKYKVKPTDLNELIKKSSEMFGRTKKEITIHRKSQEDIWAVEVDQSQIEQVLLNLYVNAWQSMPGGGELYLATENVMLDSDYVKPYSIEPGKYVEIIITDTGVGMDKATSERIFDPFFTTKEMGRGTGLGLASAYGIIKNHGGIINVYSEKGEGAVFSIYLPASEKEIISEKKLSEEVLTGIETILLVDDEDLIIDVGEEFLKMIGYKVLIAKGGKAAVELYEANKDKIDIVILDMIMPDMGGGETYDKLKEMNPEIKVLLSSGYSIDGQATEILERGCNGFIQKPFTMKGLSQKIREILDEK